MFCACAFAQAQAQIPEQEWWEKLRANVLQLPDCEYKYSVTLSDVPKKLGGPLVKHECIFSHYKGKFFYKRFGEGSNSEPVEWLAYDGNSFYRLIAGNLTIGKSYNAIQLKKPFASSFASNPAFAPFYYCIFSGKDLDFSLPFLSTPKLWVDALADIKPVSHGEGGSPLSYQITWPNRSRTFYLTGQNPYPTGCVTIPTPDTGKRIVSKISGVESYPLGVSSGYLIPEKLVQSVTKTGEAAEDVVEIVLDRRSFKLITASPKPEQYQIPRAAATTFYDTDVGAKIVK
jgi:hypothetical protein